MKQWTDDDVFVSSYQGFMFTAALLVLPFLLMRHYGELSVLSLVALLLCGGVISILGVEGNNQQVKMTPSCYVYNKCILGWIRRPSGNVNRGLPLALQLCVCDELSISDHRSIRRNSPGRQA